MSNKKEWEIHADDGDGQFAIALALMEVARSIDRLGNGDAATSMGAIEAFGLHIGEKMDDLILALGKD
jgi:hypothetical protein